MLHFELNIKHMLPVTAEVEQNRIQYNTEGQATQWPMDFDDYKSFVQPFSLFIQQPCTLNKMWYHADRNVFRVTWFYKMLT